MSEQTVFNEIEAQLGDGWGVTLISTITPGVVRLQLCGKDELYEARACVEGSTLDEAIQRAIAFTKVTDVDEWESLFWNQMEYANEPGCACPTCDLWMSPYDDDNSHTETKLGLQQFICSRCGTRSVWELDRDFPILVEQEARCLIHRY
jgi:hypothetical protein